MANNNLACIGTQLWMIGVSKKTEKSIKLRKPEKNSKKTEP